MGLIKAAEVESEVESEVETEGEWEADAESSRDETPSSASPPIAVTVSTVFVVATVSELQIDPFANCFKMEEDCKGGGETEEVRELELERESVGNRKVMEWAWGGEGGGRWRGKTEQVERVVEEIGISVLFRFSFSSSVNFSSLTSVIRLASPPPPPPPPPPAAAAAAAGPSSISPFGVGICFGVPVLFLPESIQNKSCVLLWRKRVSSEANEE